MALGLQNPEKYTCHSFRRSAATEAANSGANAVPLKLYFCWTTESTPLKYVDETKEQSRKMAKLIKGDTSTTIQNISASFSVVNNEEEKKIINIDLRNAQNVTLNFQ